MDITVKFQNISRLSASLPIDVASTFIQATGIGFHRNYGDSPLPRYLLPSCPSSLFSTRAPVHRAIFGKLKGVCCKPMRGSHCSGSKSRTPSKTCQALQDPAPAPPSPSLVFATTLRPHAQPTLTPFPLESVLSYSCLWPPSTFLLHRCPPTPFGPSELGPNIPFGEKSPPASPCRCHPAPPSVFCRFAPFPSFATLTVLSKYLLWCLVYYFCLVPPVDCQHLKDRDHRYRRHRSPPSASSA